MATLLVRKDGSGTHTTIQSAIMDAIDGDIIDIEAGTFDENVDLYKAITLKGAGKTATIIQGASRSNVVKSSTWALGVTTLNFADTTGFEKGRVISGTGIAVNTRIVEVYPTSITISLPTSAARSTATSVTMAASNDGTIRLRGTNPIVKDLKVIGFNASSVVDEIGAVTFPIAGAGSAACTGFLIENCEIEAAGEYAILGRSGSLGNGTITNCSIVGQTFVGPQPAQITVFGSFVYSSEVLSPLSLQQVKIPVAYLGNIVVGSSVTGTGVPTSTTVSAIDAVNGILTLNKAMTSGAGTFVSLTYNSVAGGTQFTVPNCPRQLVTFQSNNLPITFTNNEIKGSTGGGITYNTAITIDAPGSVITGNVIQGIHGAGTLNQGIPGTGNAYALRVRGYSTVANNTNKTYSADKYNLNYYILPNWLTNTTYQVGAIVLAGGKYWRALQTHLSTSTPVAGANWEEITLTQVNESSVAGVADADVGSNVTVLSGMVTPSQPVPGGPIDVVMKAEDVVAISKVATDPVFSNQANWNLVTYVYKKVGGTQRLVTSFRDFNANKSMKLKAGMNPGDNFQLVKMIIAKADRTLLVLKRADIPDVEAYDFVLS